MTIPCYTLTTVSVAGTASQVTVGYSSGVYTVSLPTQITNRPIGYMGQNNASGQTGITSSTTDFTGMSVTFTAVSGRRYLILVQVNVQQVTSGGDASVLIREGGSTLKTTVESLVTSAKRTVPIWHTVTPAAGSTTYKVSGSTSAGTLSVLSAGASSIMVVDIGV